ncbi:carboxylesterase/lipase family protein [Kineococcus arenarius]|uniref:carboxylesterase/lipase family protein n=1 Tax=Kineococcus sp. SYSU DK007 TaxID=3383128 RepID=UPI003D7CD9DB
MKHRTRRPWWAATLTAALALTAAAPAVGATATAQPPDVQEVVHTPDGSLRGTVTDGLGTYQGIPYAAPAQRWRPAEPVTPWAGVRDATEPGAECVQSAVFWRPGTPASTTEDCLFLNVRVPSGAGSAAPVQVFFHGGGGINGAATDVQPDRMALEGGNVVVTVNYRLGVLGGLSLPGLDAETPDGASSGNYANTDKVAALRWIQRNIASFGGDPSRVTVAGQSAGAGGVCWLLASPSAAGLFSAAAIESAGNCGDAVSREEGAARSEEFAQAAGCPDPATAVACLRSRSAADLLDVQLSTGLRFGAVAGGSDLPLAPAEAFATGAFNQVPVVIGNTRNESRAFVYEANDLVRLPLTATAYERTVRETYGDDAEELLAAYPVTGYETPGLALAALQTDARVCGALPVTRSLARQVPTYTFEFRDETAPGRPYMTVPSSFPIGSGHTSEVPYLWQSETSEPLTAEQLRLSDVMIGYWSNFARSGNPNGEGLPAWPVSTEPEELRLGLLPGGRTEVIPGAAFEREHSCSLWT